MQLLKTTGTFCFILSIVLMSCERTAERVKITDYVKTGINLTGAQENPPTPSAAQGSLDVSYSKRVKVLNYKFTWASLTDTITGIHIHGLAPVGYNAAIVQNILTTRNEPVFPFRGGSYTGTLVVDEVRVKEEDLLNGFYYLNIHTKTYPGGEIRAQIKFQ